MNPEKVLSKMSWFLMKWNISSALSDRAWLDRQSEFSADAVGETCDDSCSYESMLDDLNIWALPARVGNNDWCECRECWLMPSREECVWYHKYPETLRKMGDPTCICRTSTFALVCPKGCVGHSADRILRFEHTEKKGSRVLRLVTSKYTESSAVFRVVSWL